MHNRTANSDSDDMHCLWIGMECTKCGNKENRKYCVEHLHEIQEFFRVECSCGNKDKEHFRIHEICSAKAKPLP